MDNKSENTKEEPQIKLSDVQKRLKQPQLSLIFNPMKFDDLAEIKKYVDKAYEAKKSEKIASLEKQISDLKTK